MAGKPYYFLSRQINYFPKEVPLKIRQSKVISYLKLANYWNKDFTLFERIWSGNIVSNIAKTQTNVLLLLVRIDESSSEHTVAEQNSGTNFN